MKFFVKKSKKFVLKLVLLSFIAYVIFLFINQQVKINNKKDELAQINKQICSEKDRSEEMRNKIDEYGSNKKSNESKSGKRIFENSAE
jgi:cell division protein FtsL